MILDNATRSLQLVLGEARTTSDCDIIVCYAQTSGTQFVPTLAHTVSNGTTVVTVLAAPGSGQQFMINEVRLHNNDTVTHTVRLRLLDGATVRILYAGTVLSGADWVYTPGAGIAGTIPLASTSTPIMDGVGAAGVSTAWSAGDHVHPSDTSRAPTASPTFTGTITAGIVNVGAFTATGITASPISGSTGSFTTLAASSTVSGVGFSAYLASPPSIGSTAPAAVTGTSLRTGSTTGPTWTTGTGAPGSTEPVGSLYSDTAGGLGARLYVSAGGGAWNAVAGV